MKLTSQEEYGLRCLLQIGRRPGGMTIAQISEAEGISKEYAAKLLRLLRRGGFVKSARGQAGGYMLAGPPEQINIGEALAFLGGRIFDPDFCGRHTGIESMCSRSVDCTVRSLWRALQMALDQVLSKTTLRDMLTSERDMTSWVSDLVDVSALLKPPHRNPVMQ